MGRYLLTFEETLFRPFRRLLFFEKKKHFEKARDMVRCSTVENHVRALLGPTSVPEETEVLHDGVRGGDWGAVVQWMWWNHMKFHGKHMETHLNRDFQTCFSKTQKVVQKFHKSDGWTWKWKNSRWTDSVLDFKSQFHRPRHPTIQPSNHLRPSDWFWKYACGTLDIFDME